MFDYLAGAPSDKRRAARWTTALMSALAHGAVVLLLAIPALYATDALPQPEAAMAFFVTVPPPAPPPPPPPPAAVSPKPTARKVARATPRPTPSPRPVAAAPVEAPSEITPETGLEGIASDVVPEAGFEDGVEGGVPGGVVGGLEHVLPPPPPSPPRAAAPVRVGGAITAPRLLQRVPPEYPLIAAQAQIEGVVILEATVGRDGHVDEVKVLRSHSVLEDAAMAAVRQWVYEPLMLNGKPQPFVLTVTVSFSLTR